MTTIENPEIAALMKRFAKAFMRADAAELTAVLSGDFVWHLHYGRMADAPAGRTLHGVDGFLRELAWRKQHWREVRYEEVVEQLAGERVLQTFIVSGIDDTGRAFRTRAVDLYRIAGGRITEKDTYWKQLD